MHCVAITFHNWCHASTNDGTLGDWLLRLANDLPSRYEEDGIKEFFGLLPDKTPLEVYELAGKVLAQDGRWTHSGKKEWEWNVPIAIEMPQDQRNPWDD